jgi:RNA polymerase sigma factor (sigma-70 family)
MAESKLPSPRDHHERGASSDSLTAYIREIAKFKPLPMEEEQALGCRIRDGDQEALNRLVEANLRFVVSYAKRYRGMGLSFLDLIHEGNLGLIEAAKRYDPDRNVKFISYAVWWVRQAIFHALSEHARVFRVPQKTSGQVSKAPPRWGRTARWSWATPWSRKPSRAWRTSSCSPRWRRRSAPSSTSWRTRSAT